MRIHFKTDYLQDIRLFEDRREMIQYILLILAALSAPFWLDDYLLGEITYVLIYVLAGLGLMVLAGHTGQPSLGHAAFLACGAYMQVILLEAGLPFLLPLMLSPVAVSWMIGKSMLEVRFGPIARFFRSIGVEDVAFFSSPEMARFMIMAMDAWTFIPFMMIMILAGLQAIPRELNEAARVDGAGAWRGFWEVTFPLMLPVSVTAILIRIIFKLKLADIIINVTAGGPGGATDSVTSFIFREYRDRSNVGYGTLLAMVYLVIIVIFMTVLMKLSERWMRPRT